jgi:hypothetical protein
MIIAWPIFQRLVSCSRYDLVRYTQPRESSGASSGPPSPWGTGETKKRIVDALKNELSDIHLYTGDITTNSCAKVNYATI